MSLLTSKARTTLRNVNTSLGRAPNAPAYHGLAGDYQTAQYDSGASDPAAGDTGPAPYDPGPGPDPYQGPTFAAALPPYDPASDPSLQTLLAQLGLSETQARTAAATRIGRYQTASAIAAPRIAEAGQEARRGISYGLERRGLFRSGERLRDLALQQRGEQQRQADLQRNLANQVADTNTSLDAQIQDFARQRAQAEFDARLRAASSGTV